MIISILILALIFGPIIVTETLILIGRIAEYIQNLGKRK
jgi:hypothetical protein